MDEDKEALKDIRKKIFITAFRGRCGAAHLASSFSVVEILYVLYCKNILRIDPRSPRDPARDRLILSKGHASLALYHMLLRTGCFGDELFDEFCFPNSIFGGEPNMLEVPGVDASTGSLGHGLALGVGATLAAKMQGMDTRVYVILGDGECHEGSVWEAAMAASRYKLKDLTVIVDCNKLQKMGAVDDLLSISSLGKIWSALGWNCCEVDGHDVEALTRCLTKDADQDAPRVVLASTVKGKGVSIMENDPGWHYRMPNKRQLKVFMSELDITEDEL